MYTAVLEKAPGNPFAMAGYALLQLSELLDNRARVWQQALDLLRRAQTSGGARFVQACTAMFQLAKFQAASAPRNHEAMLVLALCAQCLMGDYETAVAAYDRALVVAPAGPHRERVAVNYAELRREMLPGGAFGDRGPGLRAYYASEVVEVCGDWARMRDGKPWLGPASPPEFWGHLVSRKTQWERPDVDQSWLEVCARSKVVELTGRWDKLYDPLLRRDVYRNRFTGLCCLDVPVDLVARHAGPSLAM